MMTAIACGCLAALRCSNWHSVFEPLASLVSGKKKKKTMRRSTTEAQIPRSADWLIR